MPLLNLYTLQEMARTRGEAMWAVMDWAAQQKGDFSYNDLYQVFRDAGGESTLQQFHSMVKVAKPWEDNQEKYAVSAKRPFVFTQRGRQGKGGAARLEWGLDGPLRAPQAPSQPMKSDDSRLNQLLDELESGLARKLGGDVAGARKQLRTMFDRWKKMKDPHRIAADIQGSLPGPYRMKALQAVYAMRDDAGGEELAAAEDDLQGAAGAQPEAPAQKSTPFAPAKAKDKSAAKQPSPADGDEDDDEDLGPGWRKLDEPVASTQQNTPEPDDDDLGPGWRNVDEPESTDSAEEFPDGFFGADEEQGDSGQSKAPPAENVDFPAFLPDPDEEGTRAENAMFRLIDEGGLDENHPLWNKFKNAKNDVEVMNIIRNSDLPKILHKSAIIVAKEVFDNTGRDWETGKKIGESKLMRIYGEGPLADPVDFDQTSGLARIVKKTR